MQLKSKLKLDALLALAETGRHVCYCSSSPPPAPDPNPGIIANAQASEKVGLESVELGRQQLAWSKELSQAQLDLSRKVVDQQLGIGEENQKLAVEDRNRFRTTFGALEDRMVADAEAFDSQAQQEVAAGKANADVIQAYDKQRGMNRRALMSFGVDPTSGKALAEERRTGVTQAAVSAGAQNKARDDTRNLGWARKLDVTSLGRGLPAQASTSYGIALNAGNSAVANSNNTANSAIAGNDSARGWFNTGVGAFGAAGGLYNSEYQGRLNAWNSSNAAAANESAGFGQLIGTGITAASTFFSSKKLKDRKENVEDAEILEDVKTLPVDRWKYKKGVADEGEHIGPYAEDFADRFGGDGKGINVVDAIGVNLAATKALAKQVDKLEKKVGFGIGKRK